MPVLGISCYYHDSAVALVDDSRVLFAIHEERLSRVKHDARFPVLAQFQSPRDLYFVSGEPPPSEIVWIQQAATAEGPPSALRVSPLVRASPLKSK